jgi:hypothetical protein
MTPEATAPSALAMPSISCGQAESGQITALSAQDHRRKRGAAGRAGYSGYNGYIAGSPTAGPDPRRSASMAAAMLEPR